MSTLKTIIRGESLSIGFIFPNGYNLSRIEDIKVYVGSKLCDVTRNETIVTCRIKSDDTKNFGTINKVTFWLDDSSLGVQKLYVGDICVDGTNATASNESVNLGFDIVVNLTISETAISVDSVLYDVMKGDKGDKGDKGENPTTYSATAPINPENGDVWISTVTLIEYVWLGAWVNINLQSIANEIPIIDGGNSFSTINNILEGGDSFSTTTNTIDGGNS